ncbi:glycosyltransferase, partial [Kitasatospora nipponensis]|uniref:glycosyltransferase n=1 Tax=Kitasatospora nipponensis TaxID=258049 RepID=UPI0031D51E38
TATGRAEHRGPGERAGGPRQLPRWVPRAALPLALVLWLLSLRGVQLGRMGDLGLLQVLPALYWAGIVVLTLGFAAALRDPGTGRGWPAGYVLGLIAMIHATPSLLYPQLRYAWAWKHIAVLDEMMRHNGTVPHAQELDIYNQWPGFFQLNALVLRATGLHSALGYAVWTPVIVNVLLLGPLLLLYRSVTQDRRLVWGGVWIFYSASWIGQDYFSPQAFAFLLYVTIMAVLVRRLQAVRAAGGAHGLRAPGREPDPAVAGWRPSRLALLLVLEAAIVSSHQLTPLMLISALLVLWLPRRNRRTVLPLLLGAVGMTLLWNATVARPFVSANLGGFVKALAAPDSNALAGLAGLGSASSGQVLLAWVDRGMSATLFALALAGFVRRPWVRRTGLPLLVIAPLPVLAANSYGGEMLFRAYLFALPATAFLAAALLLQPGSRPRLRAVAALGVLFGLLGGLFFGYYGKEDMNHFTTGEVTAGRYLAEHASTGALIISVTSDLPGLDLNYENHDRLVFTQSSLTFQHLVVSDPQAALDRADNGFGPAAYLILTRAQAADVDLTGIMPAGTVANVQAAADSSPRLTRIYQSPDAVIYKFLPAHTGDTR